MREDADKSPLKFLHWFTSDAAQSYNVAPAAAFSCDAGRSRSGSILPGWDPGFPPKAACGNLVRRQKGERLTNSVGVPPKPHHTPHEGRRRVREEAGLKDGHAARTVSRTARRDPRRGRKGQRVLTRGPLS